MSSRLLVPAPDSLGRSGVWLLELDVGGRVERFGTSAVSLVSESSEVFEYREGLKGFTRSLGNGQDQQGLEIDDNITDWAELEARGETIDWSTAKLRWWYPGQLLEQTLEVMSGVLTGPELASPDAPTRLTVTLDQRASVRAKPYPDVNAVIDATSWQNERGIRVVGASALGSYPPTVIGYPGSGDSPWAEPLPAVPVPLVDCDGTIASKLLLGFDSPVDAVTVWIFDADANTGAGTFELLNEQEAVAAGVDLEGRPVSYAAFDALDVVPREDHSYYAGFNNAAGYGGGTQYRGEVLRGLGDVIQWALEQAEIPYDRDQQEGQRAVLNRFSLDTFLGVSGGLDLERWIETALVPLFPIRRMRTGRGLWYRFVDFMATAESAVAWFDVEAGHITPTTPLQTVRGALYNKFTLEYGFNPMRGTYYHRRVLDADRPSLYTGRYIPSPVCRASQARRGVLEKAPIRTPLLWSDKTAALCLQHWAARDANPLQGRGYVGDQLDRLLPGDVVVVSDARLRFTERVALIDDIVVGGPRPTMDLVFLPNLTRLTS